MDDNFALQGNPRDFIQSRICKDSLIEYRHVHIRYVRVNIFLPSFVRICLVQIIDSMIHWP
uniref:Putative ovule protein n=1 Tax=Solanum chacoense TaxID=4108 RepID=A0A0V0HCC9_SOLCH